MGVHGFHVSLPAGTELWGRPVTITSREGTFYNLAPEIKLTAAHHSYHVPCNRSLGAELLRQRPLEVPAKRPKLKMLASPRPLGTGGLQMITTRPWNLHFFIAHVFTKGLPSPALGNLLFCRFLSLKKHNLFGRYKSC